MTFDENRPKQHGQGKILFDYIQLAPAIQFAKHYFYLRGSSLCAVEYQRNVILYCTQLLVLSLIFLF